MPGTAGAAAGRRASPAHPGHDAGLGRAVERTSSGAGFRFVGSTIVYAFMQSVGLVDDHLPGCFRYRG